MKRFQSLMRQYRTLLLTLVLSTILLGCNTQRVRFDPNAYKASSRLQAIVDRNENVVQCNEPKFDDFACMHKDKWAELRKILQDARIPKEIKVELLKKLDGINGQFKE